MSGGGESLLRLRVGSEPAVPGRVQKFGNRCGFAASRELGQEAPFIFESYFAYYTKLEEH